MANDNIKICVFCTKKKNNKIITFMDNKLKKNQEVLSVQ